MNGSITVSIRKNEFSKIARAYPEKVSQVVRKTGLDLIAASQPYTRIDTGALVNSSGIEEVSPTAIIVFWSVAYAMYQDQGTRYMSGTFFAERGAEAVRPSFIEAIKSIGLM